MSTKNASTAVAVTKAKAKANPISNTPTNHPISKPKDEVDNTNDEEDEDEDEEEEEELYEAVGEGNTTVTASTHKRVRSGQGMNDQLVKILKNAVPSKQGEDEGSTFFVSQADINTIIALINKFNKGGSKPMSSSSMPALRTLNVTAKLAQKESGFVTEYSSTEEFHKVFLPIAGRPLVTAKNGKSEFTSEITEGWTLDSKLYKDSLKFPQLHIMLEARNKKENESIKILRNIYAKDHSDTVLDGKIIKYITGSNSSYKAWNPIESKWSSVMKHETTTKVVTPKKTKA